MSDLVRLLTLQDANTRVVLIGVALLGIACGVVGVLAVLRRRALAGDAVAHAALPGVCVAYFIVGERSFSALLLGALVFGLLAAAFIAAVRAFTRIKEDAATALAIGSFFGLGIALSSIIQKQLAGDRAGLDSFLFGKAASMVAADARLIGFTAAGVLIVVILLFKELKLLCFDREFAQSLWGGGSGGGRLRRLQAWPVHALDLLLMALIAVCAVVGLPAVGVVMIVGLLIIPAAAARFWTERLGAMMLIAAAIGLSAGVLGAALSATLTVPTSTLSRGLPTGPVIILSAAAVFGVSLLFAPRRGVLAAALRRARLRRRIGIQHILRGMYERLEQRGVLASALEHPVVIASGHPARAITRAARDGLIVADGPGYRFTRFGLEEAAKVVRAHRIWELFLTEQAAIAPDHVHRPADELEHFLPRELVEKLEARLRDEGRLPVPAAIPQSVHPTRRLA